MHILVLGGTGFLGGAMTDACVAAGHRVTVATRGKTARTVPAGVEVLVLDRHENLSPLASKSFDAVIDTCAYTPDAVSALLGGLHAFRGCYALVSSISAYTGFETAGIDETAPASRATQAQHATARAMTPAERSNAALLGEAYGPMKHECERVALDRLGDRALILRVGLLVGAGDYSDRLTYWVRRVDQGGRVACPGDPRRPVQAIDVRDIARWTVEVLEAGIGGVFNVTSRTLPMIDLLETCRTVSGSDAQFTWIADDAVMAAGLAPWTQVPLWVPDSNVKVRHILNVSVDKAFARGLRTRPLGETITQILNWDRSRRDKPLKTGMPPDKEAALLS